MYIKLKHVFTILKDIENWSKKLKIEKEKTFQIEQKTLKTKNSNKYF